MSDQVETRTLTNWYIFFRDVWLPYLATVGFVLFLSYSTLSLLESVLIIGFMAGMAIIIAFNSWSRGNDDGINSTMETLVESGLILDEIIDHQVMIKPASGVEVHERCSHCGEGHILNASLTKQQNELGNEYQ